MQMIKYAFLMMIFSIQIFAAKAQYYYKAEQTSIQPLQINIGEYKSITLSDESSDPNLNRFDQYNMYTYLQLIKSSWNTTYFIIYQTDFFGKVLFLALNTGLSQLLSQPQKPMNVFANCVKKVNRYAASTQKSDAAIDCILERLNQ